jgi:excisionase family DNA binding protein
MPETTLTTRPWLRLGPPDQPVESLVYSVAEVAALLNLALGSTYALLRSGDIPARKLGSRWVIPKQPFHEWLDSISVSNDSSASSRHGTNGLR